LTQNTYEQFRDITEVLLSRHKIEGQVASAIAGRYTGRTARTMEQGPYVLLVAALKKLEIAAAIRLQIQKILNLK
jgi:hypothetical protein